MLKEFKTFLLRGNVVDLSVGVVVGAAFGSVVTALVKDIITPLIGALGKQPDFSSLTFTINGSKFMYGDFINALLSFLIVTASIYFFVVLPISRLSALAKRNEAAPAPTTKKCPECMSEVHLQAKRCTHCTAPIV